MKGSTKNKLKYWAKALAMDSDALNYALGTPRAKVRKHVEYYLPIFRDTIRCLEELLTEYDEAKTKRTDSVRGERKVEAGMAKAGT